MLSRCQVVSLRNKTLHLQGGMGLLLWAATRRGKKRQRILLLNTFLFFKLWRASQTLCLLGKEECKRCAEFVKIDRLILLSLWNEYNWYLQLYDSLQFTKLFLCTVSLKSHKNPGKTRNYDSHFTERETEVLAANEEEGPRVFPTTPHPVKGEGTADGSLDIHLRTQDPGSAVIESTGSGVRQGGPGSQLHRSITLGRVLSDVTWYRLLICKMDVIIPTEFSSGLNELVRCLTQGQAQDKPLMNGSY